MSDNVHINLPYNHPDELGIHAASLIHWYSEQHTRMEEKIATLELYLQLHKQTIRAQAGDIVDLDNVNQQLLNDNWKLRQIVEFHREIFEADANGWGWWTENEIQQSTARMIEGVPGTRSNPIVID